MPQGDCTPFKSLLNNFDASKLATGSSAASSRTPNLRALEAGTAEAFAASRRNLNPARNVDERIAKVNEEQLVEQKAIREGIEKLAEFDSAPFGLA